MPGALPDESWTVAQGEYEGRPLLLRFNEGAPPPDQRGSWPLRVGVAVRFRKPDGNGFPSAADAAVLERVEEAIGAVVAERGAMFAFVVTTCGMREFVAYATNHDDGRAIAEAAQGASAGAAVQASGRRDPGWEGYEEFSP
jgi:hypothetical protein